MDKDCLNVNTQLSKLISSIKFIEIDTSSTTVMLDDSSAAVLKRVNLHAMLRAASSEDAAAKRCYVFDYIQSPVIGYFDKNGVFRVIGGIVTFHQFFVNGLNTLPAFVLDKPLSAEQRNEMALAELVKHVLDLQMYSGVEHLHDVMCALFNTNTAGIFTLPLWQKLYPGIKNKAQFCTCLRISSKTFREKRERTDA
jgi:hypothetical protein